MNPTTNTEALLNEPWTPHAPAIVRVCDTFNVGGESRMPHLKRLCEDAARWAPRSVEQIVLHARSEPGPLPGQRLCTGYSVVCLGYGMMEEGDSLARTLVPQYGDTRATYEVAVALLQHTIRAWSNVTPEQRERIATKKEEEL